MVNMTDEFLVALDSLVKKNSKIMYSAYSNNSRGQ